LSRFLYPAPPAAPNPRTKLSAVTFSLLTAPPDTSASASALAQEATLRLREEPKTLNMKGDPGLGAACNRLHKRRPRNSRRASTWISRCLSARPCDVPAPTLQTQRPTPFGTFAALHGGNP